VLLGEKNDWGLSDFCRKYYGDLAVLLSSDGYEIRSDARLTASYPRVDFVPDLRFLNSIRSGVRTRLGVLHIYLAHQSRSIKGTYVHDFGKVKKNEL
jgi:hypothetical protein